MQNIENVVFYKVGDMFSYKYEKVIINHPEQNIYGLVKIGNDYYKQIYIKP